LRKQVSHAAQGRKEGEAESGKGSRQACANLFLFFLFFIIMFIIIIIIIIIIITEVTPLVLGS